MKIKIKLNDDIFELTGKTFAEFRQSIVSAMFSAETKEEAQLLGYVLSRYQDKWFDGEADDFGKERIDAWADDDEFAEDMKRWLFYAKKQLEGAKHE